MRRHMFEHDLIENAEFYTRQMLVAELMLEKIINDDFLAEEFDAHEKKWGKAKIDFIDDPNGPGGRIDIYHEKARALGPEAEKQERKEYMDLIDRQEKAKEKMYDDLFKWIRDHIQYWWD